MTISEAEPPAKNKSVSTQDHNKFCQTLRLLQVTEEDDDKMVYIFIHFVHFKDVKDVKIKCSCEIIGTVYFKIVAVTCIRGGP
jgi:hypothetical protein